MEIFLSVLLGVAPMPPDRCEPVEVWIDRQIETDLTDWDAGQFPVVMGDCPECGDAWCRGGPECPSEVVCASCWFDDELCPCVLVPSFGCVDTPFRR